MSCISVTCGKTAFSLKPSSQIATRYALRCKEDMRQAFYVREDEEAALKWRPGKCNDCWWRNCKHNSWESYEDEYHEGYIQDLKSEEFVSSDEED